MSEDIQPGDGRLEHPDVRHEKTDASFRWILYLVLTAVVLAVLIHLVIAWFFFGYRDHLDQARKSPFPLAPTPSDKLPPEPRLEQVDRLAGNRDVNVSYRQRARETVLQSYGPTEEKGYVHIPIERALKLLANQLPARTDRGALANLGASTVGLLASPLGPGPLLAAAALCSGRSEIVGRRRDLGLIDSGASNSGRLFRREPRWFER